MQNNDQAESFEVLAPSAIMAMEKAQIDQQIATAHQYPRSLEQFRKRAMSMATLDPETAESCIYTRNVGKEMNKATGKWEDKFAEGPSIRLAEIVAVSYGNLRAASKVVEQTERYVKCVGMAHDLESNTAMSADVIESTVTREGKPYSERQRALIAKVCGAKALRDAILKVVPRALCKPILEGAKKVAQGLDKPLDERRKKAQAWISGLKISDERVLGALGVKEWAQVTAEHLLTLTGLKTAMSDGDETIDGAFPPIERTAESTKPEPTAHQKATQEAGKAPEEKKAPTTTATTATTSVAAPAEIPKTAKEDDIPMEGKTPLAAKDAPQTNPETPAATQTPSEGTTPQAPGSGEPSNPESAAATSNEPPDPLLRPEEGDTDSVASVKLLAQKGGVNWFQLRTYLLAKNLMRANQTKLSELATSKLDNLGKSFPKFLAEIRALPRSVE